MYGNTDRAALDSALSELDGVVQKGMDRFRFNCPLEHRKKDAIAEIWLDDKGKIGGCCHDCRRNAELWNAVVRPHIPRSRTPDKATYTYDHPDGEPRVSYRIDGPEGKRIWQPRRQNIYGTYVKLWLPLGENDDGLIVWVEGEKCAQAIAEIGYIGASSIPGANNVDKADYSPLYGRHVLVWPDDDQAGRKAGGLVARFLLEAGAARVQLAHTPRLDDGSDAADLDSDERLAKLLELLDTTPDFEASESSENSSRTGDVQDDEMKSPWTILGEVCAGPLRMAFRFDTFSRQWLAWRDGTHWASITDTTEMTDILHYERLRLAAQLGKDGQHALTERLASANQWRREISNMRGEWWGALRTTLDRPMSKPPFHQVATPEGVVDLRTGNIESHDPWMHDTRVLTRGNYRPQDANKLRHVLWQRLKHNIAPDDFDQLIATIGIAVARRSVDYRTIAWFYGAPGSGKSSTAQIIVDAFGGLAKGISANLVTRRSRSDIDADLTDLIEFDPVIYWASEVGTAAANRLYGLTGGDVFSARRPHGRIVRGALSGMLLATSVEAPRVAVDTGLRRRIIVFHFPKRISEGVRRSRSYSADELDAVVSLSIIAAMEVETEGWVPPRGSEMAAEEFLTEADPLAAWIAALPDSWDGQPVKDCLEAYNSEALEPANPTLMGRRINTSGKWRSVSDRRRNVSVLRLLRTR